MMALCMDGSAHSGGGDSGSRSGGDPAPHPAGTTAKNTTSARAISTIAPGVRVELSGLPKAPELNGWSGVVGLPSGDGMCDRRGGGKSR